jgi:hypothetical protein
VLTERVRALPPFVVLAFILLATFVLYAPVLNDWFFADDFVLLRRSQTISWDSWLRQSWDYRSLGPVPGVTGYRPLFLLTFKAQYSVFGLHASGYHAVNIAVHMTSVVLLWFVALRLTGRTWFAHVTALIFGLQPVYSDAVAWISNGNTVLATVPYLASVLCFLNYAQARSPRIAWYAAFLVFFVISILYHPVALPLAAVLPLCYLCVRGESQPRFEPQLLLAIAPIALIGLAYVFIQREVREDDFVYATSYAFGRHMFDNYVDYTSLALYPVPNTRFGAFAVAIVLLVSFALALSWRRSWVGPLAVAWFFTSLAPASLFTLGAYPRLMYLSGAPLALLFASAVFIALDVGLPRLRSVDSGRGLQRLLAAPAAFAVAFAFVVFARKYDVSWPPSFTVNIGPSSAESQAFIRQLREDEPTLPDGGTLYVANAPLALTFLRAPEQVVLDSIVELYYGDTEVKAVPLEAPPFWNEDQVREALRPQDRLFVYR